ncbi:MAG TPA: sigma-70 family RNA polymerase sigma factor [Firmicutes bacterium]|nr:sigma-70 family RNA polymerase sigma factor [Bacillota bacterium]
MDDLRLLELLETNPSEGMALLEKEYGEPVRFAAAQRLDSAEDIRLCAHDTFSDFYLHRERFDPAKGSLRAYLTAISERKAIRRWRENQRQWLAAQPADLSENAIGAWERKEQLRQALARLPELDRNILLLKYFGGCTTREAAARLGIDYERAKKRAQRALKKLPQLLE